MLQWRALQDEELHGRCTKGEVKPLGWRWLVKALAGLPVHSCLHASKCVSVFHKREDGRGFKVRETFQNENSLLYTTGPRARGGGAL